MEAKHDFTSFLARHLVAMTLFDRSPQCAAENHGAGRYLTLTGFLVSVRGVWMLMTAGHIVATLDEALRRGQRLEGWHLDDTMGWMAQHGETIPFDYPNSRRFHVDENGYDYGVIQLRPNHQSLLLKNKVVALGEESWERAWPESFEAYWMLGIPSQLISIKPADAGRVEINGMIVRLAVRKIDDPPDELRVSADRFYGRITLPTSCPSLTDINGMSGGPIFGFNHGEDGRLRYWLYAMQSGWHRPTQTIAACPVQPFLKAVAAHVDEYVHEEESR